MRMTNLFAAGILALGLLAGPALASTTVITKTGQNIVQVAASVAGLTRTSPGHWSGSSSGVTSVTTNGSHTYLPGPVVKCGAFWGDFDQNCTLRSLAQTMGGGNTQSTPFHHDTTVAVTKTGPGTFTTVTTTVSK